MKNIELNYREFFRDHSISIDVPECWSELNKSQFKAASRVYVDDIQEDEFISDFYGISKRLVAKMSAFQKYRLSEIIQFVLNPDGKTNQFYVDKIDSLLSPSSKLKNVSVEHFCIMDTLFFDFANDTSDESLDRFVASVYLKKNEKITDVDMNKRLRLIKEIDKSTKYAVFLNYIFIRRWLSKAFPILFQTDEYKSGQPNSAQKVRKNHRPDWNSLIDGIVGDDILNHHQYTQLPCIIFFKSANHRLKKWQDAK